MSLGSQLREARTATGLTITEVAERTGLSPGYISQVERDRANPSIGAVNRIAGVRWDRRKGLTYPGSNVRHELLTPSLQRALQILMCRAPAGTTHGDVAIAHEGEECGIVLAGKMELMVGDETFTLEAGDTIYFDAARPHSWTSLGPDDLEVIWVMTPPHF